MPTGVRPLAGPREPGLLKRQGGMFKAPVRAEVKTSPENVMHERRNRFSLVFITAVLALTNPLTALSQEDPPEKAPAQVKPSPPEAKDSSTAEKVDGQATESETKGSKDPVEANSTPGSTVKSDNTKDAGPKSASPGIKTPVKNSLADNQKPKQKPKVTKKRFSPEEEFYQIVIERQRLAISSNKHILVILDAHGGDPLRARKDIKTHERERDARLNMIFEKHGIDPKEYYRSSRGTKEQKKRAKYLDGHPEIRDEIAENSKQLKALEKEVWRKMNPLWTSWPDPEKRP
jgi:hypothetical protein